MKYEANDFYPTPKSILTEITAGIDWKKIDYILEPSAGKGDMAIFCREKKKDRWGIDPDIDCIEINTDLQSVLKGKGLRVIHDDFLTFETYKHYDLILMNPPFSQGCKHLLKALSLQQDNCGIICILNAETIRNPFSNERKELIQKLKALDASITYMDGAFSFAEHPTDVSIAVVKIILPERKRVSFFEKQLKSHFYENISSGKEMDQLAPNDYILAAVQQYNAEIELGIKLIKEYQAITPYILDDIRPDIPYKKPILNLQVLDHDLSVNRYVKAVRRKYWNALFSNPKFTSGMTSDMARQYHEQVSELVNYDFSIYNIKTIQIDITKHLIGGIEDCIIKLFDKLSYQYAYSDELSGNIHYYNGWKTNKCWKINNKVILPGMNAFSSWSGKFDPSYSIKQQLSDIEKALNYLDGGLTHSVDLEASLRQAAADGITRKIRLKYFYVTFYKKGTCHIEFTNDQLLKKLNIFGSQQKGWLPPAYGKKVYQEMSEEEKTIINSFEGKSSYEQTVSNPDYFIYNPGNQYKLAI